MDTLPVRHNIPSRAAASDHARRSQIHPVAFVRIVQGEVAIALWNANLPEAFSNLSRPGEPAASKQY